MKVPLSRPYLGDDSKKDEQLNDLERGVLRVLRSGRHIKGPEVEGFEKEFAHYIGSRYAVATNSCTSAEQLALMAAGIGKGDEVLVPTQTMFATVEPIVHVGAVPVFVDSDELYGLDVADAASKVTARTWAIIPVHLYGNPVDMAGVRDLAQRHNLLVFEDCAQSHGAEYAGRRVGSLGMASMFSFFPSKNLGGFGDGGMILTDDEQVARKARMLRDHGREGRFGHEYFGFNMRMSEAQAVYARVQLTQLDNFTQARRERAGWYGELLAGTPLELPVEREGGKHVFHLYVARTSSFEEREGLLKHLKGEGVEANVHYPTACHREPAVLSSAGIRSDLGDMRAMDYANRIISLPMFPTLRREEAEYVADQVKRFYRQL